MRHATHRRTRSWAPYGAFAAWSLTAMVTVLLSGSGHAHAAPLANELPPTPETEEQILLAKTVQARERALAALDRKAASWSRVLESRAAHLSDYGYTGDPEEATHVLPLAGYHLSAGFGKAGPLWEKDHTGQDFGAASGTPLVALADAVVTEVGDAGPYGLRTVLTLADGTEVWYCHQEASLVTAGETIDMAEPLGQVGTTGNSTGPHLHLEIRPAGEGPVDPMEWLRAYDIEP
ncbi:M23 family metallopeptidase [Nocardioides houyundeii]|uniref:M23 family metallopeptidase n=1 Tax=Nocardioides houyundeii TaxID=2045452 RepID=UPI000C76319C|nr:M23 family metallopeptidase [Nocardioides houyundeii]